MKKEKKIGVWLKQTTIWVKQRTLRLGKKKYLVDSSRWERNLMGNLET